MAALAVLGVVIVAAFVDVSPRVEGDFFFAENDPQMQARRMVVDAVDAEGRPIQRMGSMLKFDGAPAEAEPPAGPPEGDADGVLAEHGYSPAEIEALRRDQIVA